MRLKTRWLILALMLSVLSPRLGNAEDTNGIALGIRGGISATDNEESFEQYEAFAIYDLPWRWQWPSGWDLRTRIDTAIGTISGGGETGFVGSVGPGIALTHGDGIVSIFAGISPAYISKNNFGDENLGGAFQFISHAGINLRLFMNLGVGYRIQHMSNAGVYDKNPGINLHMLELSWYF